jgi:hypothetical protein
MIEIGDEIQIKKYKIEAGTVIIIVKNSKHIKNPIPHVSTYLICYSSSLSDNNHS